MGPTVFLLISRRLGNDFMEELWYSTLTGNFSWPQALGGARAWSTGEKNLSGEPTESCLLEYGLCPFWAPSWCLEQTACRSLLQIRWPASVLTRGDTIENCIRPPSIGICSKYITEHKWLADTACLAVCKGNGSMDFWIRREGLFFLCEGTSSWWPGRKLI